MNRKYSGIVLSSLVSLLFAVTVSLAQASQGPVPPNSNAYGKNLSEWAAAWLQWAFAIPGDPFSDPTGQYAAYGQSIKDKVWFLAGTSGGSAERRITVPTGAALFFPILNYWWVNTPETGDNPWSPEQEDLARGTAKAAIDGTSKLSLTIDGRPVSEKVLYSYRAASSEPATICMLPENNIFVGWGYSVDAGPHECVADGYWALLPPLSVGAHTVNFTGQLGDNEFNLDVTYYITVEPRQKVR